MATTFADGDGRLVLERSRRLRLFTLFILYVGQGLPLGLFLLAVPIWMAVNGASAGEVGSVAGLSVLPWSLKFANGFLMDRYTYLPMGRRRAWILGAQAMIVLVLLFAALISPSASDVVMLGAIGFALNLATAFQDVAVDGLAVDIMSEDERARGSGMMFGGQSIGKAVATAICGLLLGDFGAPVAFLAVAAGVLVLCVYTAMFRERVGEKCLPWNKGEANPRNLDIQLEAWWPILRSTFLSLFARTSLLWIVALFFGGIMFGAMTGAVPLIGANDVGWDTSTISWHAAAAGLVGGIAAMTLGGWLGDRYGAKRTGVLWLVLSIALMALMYATVPHWSNPALFLLLAYGWAALNVLRIVAVLPISMRLCDAKVAATQFTIYMAMSNFGISFGGFMLGLTDEMGGLQSIFLVVAAGLTVMLLILVAAPLPRRPEYYAREAKAAMVYDSAGPIPEQPSAAR